MRWPSNSNAVVTHCGWTDMNIPPWLCRPLTLPSPPSGARVPSNPSPHWGEGRVRGVVDSADDRDPFDLDQAVVVVEAPDLDESHGRVVPAEVLPVHRADVAPVRLVLGLGEHVDGELDDVVHLAGARRHQCLQVLADLPELGDQIALADHLARLVQRDLPGHVEGLATLDLPAVSVADRLG